LVLHSGISLLVEEQRQEEKKKIVNLAMSGDVSPMDTKVLLRPGGLQPLEKEFKPQRVLMHRVKWLLVNPT
jgi:hypothetical protein